MKRSARRGAKAPLFLLALFLILSVVAFAEDSLRETPVVKAVKRAAPAVVNISTEKLVEPQFGAPFHDPFFERFFKDFFPELGPQKRQSLGSGVIIDSKGYILTNAHVILRGSTITVGLYDGRNFEAELVGSDPDLDLAVLKVDADEKLPVIPIGTSRDLMVGEPVIAIGNPYGFSHTVTSGVISALNRTIRVGNRTYSGFIQTDTPINPGNSGGALLNIYGELIGVNTAIYSRTGGYQGIGFAIPVDRAMKIVASLLKYGRFKRGYFGFSVQPLDPQLALALGLDTSQGMIVNWLDPDGPAGAAGLKRGDVIVSVNSSACSSPEDFNSLMGQQLVGEKVELGLVRSGLKVKVEIKSVEFDSKIARKLAWRKMGVELAKAGEGLRITKIRARGPAAEAGLRVGDGLIAINEQPMSSMDGFVEAVAKLQYARSAILTIKRKFTVCRFVFSMEQ